MASEVLSKDPLTLKGKERDGWLVEKQNKLMEQIRNYKKNPEDLHELMTFMTQFHNYSLRNLMLIRAQWDGAYAVASYKRWKELGFPVKRKEDGGGGQILIWVPVRSKFIKLEDGTYVSWKDSTKKQKEQVARGELKAGSKLRFTSGFVYDITQTSAEPEDYPKIFPNRHYHFNDDNVNYEKVLGGIDNIANEIGTELFWDENRELGNAKGAYFHNSHKILMNPLNTPSESVSVAIHELAHAHMHRFKSTPSAIKELQAELASTLVCSVFNLDTVEEAVRYISTHLNTLETANENLKEDEKKYGDLDNVLADTQETVKLFIKIINKELD